MERKSSLSSILSQLRNESGDSILTKEEIQSLLSLTFGNGEKMFQPEQQDFTYEFVHLIELYGFDSVFLYLSAFTDSKPNKNLRKDILLNHEVFNDARNHLYTEINDFKNPVKIIEGGVSCVFCGSDDTVTPMKQTRSGDEGQLVKTICLSCCRSFRES